MKNSRSISSREENSLLASFLLLLAILLARVAPNLSREVKLYLDIEFIATLTLESINALVGWQTRLYTIAYDGLTLIIFLAFAGIIWPARKS
jgi:hypothetical protein